MNELLLLSQGYQNSGGDGKYLDQLVSLVENVHKDLQARPKMEYYERKRAYLFTSISRSHHFFIIVPKVAGLIILSPSELNSVMPSFIAAKTLGTTNQELCPFTA